MGQLKSTPSRFYAPAIIPAPTGNTLSAQAQAEEEAADLSALPETLLPIEQTKTGRLSAERQDATYHPGTELIGLSTPDAGNVLDSASMGNPECREAHIVHPHVAAELGEPQASLDLQRKLDPPVGEPLFATPCCNTSRAQHGRRHQNHPTRNPFFKSCSFSAVFGGDWYRLLLSTCLF